MTFESTRVDGKNGKLNVTGKLTMRGITKDITFLMEVSRPRKNLSGKQRIGITSHLTIERRGFGILYDRKLDSGEMVLSNEIEVIIDAEAQQTENNSMIFRRDAKAQG